MTKKMTRPDATKWMARLYYLAFFSGVGIFFLMNIQDIIQNKHMSEQNLDSSLLMMVVMWSLGGVVAGLDYFERRKFEDKESANKITGESR